MARSCAREYVLPQSVQGNCSGGMSGEVCSLGVLEVLGCVVWERMWERDGGVKLEAGGRLLRIGFVSSTLFVVRELDALIISFKEDSKSNNAL